MAGIDRRAFVAGLGALLGTTALVKPAVIEAVTNANVRDAVWSVSSDGGYFYGRYFGIVFVENDELRFERIDPADMYE